MRTARQQETGDLVHASFNLVHASFNFTIESNTTSVSCQTIQVFRDPGATSRHSKRILPYNRVCPPLDSSCSRTFRSSMCTASLQFLQASAVVLHHAVEGISSYSRECLPLDSKRPEAWCTPRSFIHRVKHYTCFVTQVLHHAVEGISPRSQECRPLDSSEPGT